MFKDMLNIERMDELCGLLYPGCEQSDRELEGELFDVYGIIRVDVNGKLGSICGPIIAAYVCVSTHGHEHHIIEIVNTDEGTEVIDAGYLREYQSTGTRLDPETWLNDQALPRLATGTWKKNSGVAFQKALNRAFTEFFMRHDTRYLSAHIAAQRKVLSQFVGGK